MASARFLFSRLLTFTVLLVLISGCNLPIGGLDGLEDAVLFAAITGSDSNDCQTAETACRSIQRVVTVANELPVAIINIAAGTYDESEIPILYQSMTFTGEGAVVINRLPGPNPESNDHIFVSLPPAGGVVRFENLTIQGGEIGIRVGRGRLILNQVTLQDIRLNAVYANDLDVTANISISDSQIINNGDNPISAYGDGVYISIRNSEISGNNGTPIINRGANIELDGVAIFDNHATGGYPSAILNMGTDSTVTEGGIINITNSSIYNNTSTEASSDTIRNGGELLSMVNSTISGNDGNGLYAGRNSETALTHVTIANQPGAGLIALDVLDLRVNLTNSLLVYNGRDCELQTIYSDAPTTRITSLNNIDSDNTCREPQSEERAAWDFYPGVDSTLQVNGSGLPTHALLDDSPVIDSIPCAVGITTDQRGIARPQGANCDAGAYEREPILGEPPLAPTNTPLAILLETTPQETLPVLPTQIQASATPSPFVRFITSANCRYGPGTVYAVYLALPEGTKASLIGRNANSTWLQIKPDNEPKCWVSASAMESVGTISNLPVIPAPPTPTPTITATPTVSVQIPSAPQQLYFENLACNGQIYSLTLRWLDTSSNETGFRVYRDGALLATLGVNSTSHADAPPYGGPYTYSVEAFNTAGSSGQTSIIQAGCIP